MFRRGNNLIEVDCSSFRDIPKQLFIANDVAALLSEHLMELLISKHTDAYLFTSATGQHTGTSHVLVTLSRVHIERKDKLYSLWELALFRNLL